MTGLAKKHRLLDKQFGFDIILIDTHFVKTRRNHMIKTRVRLIAMLMTLLTVFYAFSACKKPDPDIDPDEEDNEMENYYLKIEKGEVTQETLFDYSDQGFRDANAALFAKTENDAVHVSEVVVYDGYDEWEYASICAEGKTSFELKAPLINDWRDYDKLSVAVYSAKATNTTVMLYFSSPNVNNTKMDPYIRFPIVVDFAGWQVLEFDIQGALSNYSPNISNIVKCNYATSGWDLTCSSENVLYFGYMYLLKQGYNVISEVPISDPALYKTVKDQWREYLVGSPDESAVHSDTYNQRVSNISKACKTDWDSFKATYSNGEVGKLWGQDVVFGIRGSEVKINNIYNNLYDMACGYAAVGSDYYHNAELYSDIVKGLEYAYTNYYGPAVWEKGTYGNWWNWDIGIPLKLTKILMLLENELGAEAVKKYLSPFDYLNEYPSMTACNRLWIGNCVLASAFLQNDAKRILISKEMLYEIFDYVTTGDGFYTDGSFVQHEKLSYTGGYGRSMFNELTQIMFILRGSRFEFYQKNADNQYRWAFENFQPVIYDGRFFASTRGREVYRNTSETSAANDIMAALIQMSVYAPDEYKPKLKALVRHHMLATNKDYSSNVPLVLVDYAVALKNNDDVTPRTEYELVKVFGNMDRVAQHGEKYGACVSMSSSRIYKYEAINEENRRGWYQGDGMLYVYTDGYDYNYSYFDFVNPFKLPGTTVSGTDRVQQNISPNLLGSSAFAGGVEQGKYGIAAMELGYAQNKYFVTDLNARKSYFMFDNEIVALGSDIRFRSASNLLANEEKATLIENEENGVYTVVENRIWRSSDVLTVNGNKVSLSAGNTRTETVKTMHFTNMGGYVFTDGTTLTYGKSQNSGQVQTNKTNTFLEATYSHGSAPNGDTYAFIYLPEATAEETVAYADNTDITILTLTDKVHAVRENKLGATGYVFYESGSASGVTAELPCAVMVTDKDGEVRISISDPTHKLTEMKITVELGRNLSVKSADSGVTTLVKDGRAIVTVSCAGNVGNTYSVTLG